MHIRHTHPPGTTPEARAENLCLLYHRCLRALYGDSRLSQRIAPALPAVR